MKVIKSKENFMIRSQTAWIWKRLKFVSLVVENSLRNKKFHDYTDHVENTLLYFQKLECNKSIMIYFFDCHLYRFPANLGDLNEEHDEHFHQDFFIMEKRQQDRWDKHKVCCTEIKSLWFCIVIEQGTKQSERKKSIKKVYIRIHIYKE